MIRAGVTALLSQQATGHRIIAVDKESNIGWLDLLSTQTVAALKGCCRKGLTAELERLAADGTVA
jgi:hypothetical protein